MLQMYEVVNGYLALPFMTFLIFNIKQN